VCARECVCFGAKFCVVSHKALAPCLSPLPSPTLPGVLEAVRQQSFLRGIIVLSLLFFGPDNWSALGLVVHKATHDESSPVAHSLANLTNLLGTCSQRAPSSCHASVTVSKRWTQTVHPCVGDHLITLIFERCNSFHVFHRRAGRARLRVGCAGHSSPGAPLWGGQNQRSGASASLQPRHRRGPWHSLHWREQ
jgi:hypothetical protein